VFADHSLPGLEPGNNFGPYLSVRLAPYQDSEVLKANARLARILDDPGILRRHCVNKGLDRAQGSHIIGDVYDRERGDGEA
jgi:hypothetical protein